LIIDNKEKKNPINDKTIITNQKLIEKKTNDKNKKRRMVNVLDYRLHMMGVPKSI